MDNFIYIADDFFFLCIGLLLLYLFILAVASHAIKKVDMACTKGIMHKNAAARKVSQLAKKLG